MRFASGIWKAFVVNEYPEWQLKWAARSNAMRCGAEAYPEDALTEPTKETVGRMI